MGDRTYRITGPQSVDRLTPLLMNADSSTVWRPHVSFDDCKAIDFVWETTCEKMWRDKHESSIIFNRLHNSQVPVAIIVICAPA